MVKKLMVSAVVATLLLGAANAWATASRMETLGDQGLYLVDDTNVFDNPAPLTYYRDRLFVHMGGLEGGDVSSVLAIAFGIGDSATLGLVVGGQGALVAITESSVSSIRNDAIMGGAFVDYFGLLPGPIPPNDVSTTWANPVGVILTYQVGNIGFGGGYMLANGKYDDKDDIAETEDEHRAVLNDIDLGMTGKFGKMQPEVWFHFAPYWIRSKWTDDINDYESEQKLRGNKYVLGGRLIYKLSDKVTVVPAIKWERATGRVKIDTDPNTLLTLGGQNFNEEDLSQKYLVDTLTTGLNLQYHTGGYFGLLITGSASLDWSRWRRRLNIDTTDYGDKDIRKSFAAPTVRLGVEYWINHTLCFRSGISTTTVWANTVNIRQHDDVAGTETTDTKLMETTQLTSAAAGMGLHFGNMLIDATFGNFFLSNEDGGSNGPNLFSHLDIKVKW